MVMAVGLILLIFLSIMILTLSSRRPYTAHGPGRIAIALVAPFQKVIIHTTRFLSEIWEHYFFLVSVSQENEHLHRELREAKALNFQCRETQLANERLRGLLGLGKKIKQPLIAAEVVGKDPSPWFQTVLVDKGSADGVRKGLPVINREAAGGGVQRNA